MKRFNINLPDALYERLRREAFDSNISMSQLVVGKIDIPPLPAQVSDEIKDVLRYGGTTTPAISIKDGAYSPAERVSKITNDVLKKKGYGYCKHGFIPKLCKYQECRK